MLLALSGRDHLGRRGADDREIQVCWRRMREENSVGGRRWRENQEKEAKESQSEYRTTGKGRERRAGSHQLCKQGGQTFPGAGDSDSPRAGPLLLPLQKELRPGRGPGPLVCGSGEGTSSNFSQQGMAPGQRNIPTPSLV